jgi:hypothetical protein
LLVAVRGVDPATVTGTVELARRAGAIAPGVLWLEKRWSLAADGDVAALAQATGVATGTKARVRNDAFDVLTARLAGGAAAGDDVLGALVTAGFVAYEGVGDAGNRPLSELGGIGLRVVFVVGTDGALSPKESLLPFAQGAIASNLPLVGAELYVQADGGPSRGSLVGVVRGDASLAAKVSTVDDLDEPLGPVVSLLALSDLGRNVVNAYGLGDGAVAVGPEWWQP